MRFSGVNDEAFKVLCEKAHSKAMEVVAARFPQVVPEMDKLEVELSRRLATCAGKAQSFRTKADSFYKHQIRMNYRLLSENLDEVMPTYSHELMHIVASILYPRERVGHGLRWKLLMTMIGESDERCHKMDVSAFRKPKVRYAHSCKDCARMFFLTKHKHNRQVSRNAYRCRCGGHLEYKEGPVGV